MKLFPCHPQKSLDELILSLSDDDLVALYRKTWNKSQNEFCRMFAINKGNFSRWLQRKKNSFASACAVRKYLRFGVPREHPLVTSSVSLTSSLPPQSETSSLKSLGANRTPKEMKLFKRLRDPSPPRVVIFVDADNSLSSLPEIENFLISNKSFPIHVILCISNLNIFTKITEEEWMDVFCPQSSIRNAADFALCMHIAALNVSVDENIHFLLISKDYFGFDAMKWVHYYKPKRSMTQLRNAKEISSWLAQFAAAQIHTEKKIGSECSDDDNNNTDKSHSDSGDTENTNDKDTNDENTKDENITNTTSELQRLRIRDRKSVV